MNPPSLESTLARLNGRINWERKLRQGAMRVDLAPMEDLMGRLDHPERAVRVVHVAGSKGKGSVARLIAEGLRSAGFAVGVYASPHVETIHERIRLDGDWVSDAPLAEALHRVLEARDAAEAEHTAASDATWFDLVTAAAFCCFRAAGLDWAVVEVGLGGRLDSTNVVQPSLCVITSIELEHTDILGTTRSAIAREKAGILKLGSVLACGVPPDRSRGIAEDAGHVIATTAMNLGIYWECITPKGSFDERNQSMARLGLNLLGERGIQAPRGSMHAGLITPEVIEAARLPGRLEKFSAGGVPVVLDGAHVAASLTAVFDQLEGEEFAKAHPQVVFALGQDKDATALLKTLVGRADRVHCTSVKGSLHRPPAELEVLASEAGLASQTHNSPRQALRHALDAAGANGWVLVTGSLHLVGALRPELRAQASRPPS